MHTIRYLTEAEIVAINLYLIKTYSPGEKAGVKIPTLLNSAVFRPQQSAFLEDRYGSLFEKAAALFDSLAKNHAFHNANKRTAFVSMVQFLKYNGYRFTAPQKQAEDFTVEVVQHKYPFEKITAWIEHHSKPTT
jgi:death on curing protein